MTVLMDVLARVRISALNYSRGAIVRAILRPEPARWGKARTA
jgi:hypothetical protein